MSNTYHNKIQKIVKDKKKSNLFIAMEQSIEIVLIFFLRSLSFFIYGLSPLIHIFIKPEQQKSMRL